MGEVVRWAGAPERKIRFSEAIDLYAEAEFPFDGGGEQFSQVRESRLIRQAADDYSHREPAHTATPVFVFVPLLTRHFAHRLHGQEAARASVGGRDDAAREVVARRRGVGVRHEGRHI